MRECSVAKHEVNLFAGKGEPLEPWNGNLGVWLMIPS